MGERVVVGRATPVEPINEAGGTPPLDYGRGDRAGDAWRMTRAWASAFFESVLTLSQTIINVLGGLPRIGFALGLGCVLGGIGACFGHYAGDGAFWMFVGGALIGLTLRVPLRRLDEPAETR